MTTGDGHGNGYPRFPEDSGRHDLEKTCPGFLRYLDSDRNRAWEELHVFVSKWSVSAGKSMPELRSLDDFSRRELVSDLIHDLVEEDFRKLRLYHPKGRPFAVWLWRCMQNFARSRRRARVPESMENPEVSRAMERIFATVGFSRGQFAGEWARLIDLVHQHLPRLSPKCRTLIGGSLQGYEPRELCGLFSPPLTSGQISNGLRGCRDTLIRRMFGDDPPEWLFGNRKPR